MSVPAAVQAAVAAFEPDVESGFTLARQSQARHTGWICLGSQACRNNWTLIPLYGGKTSNGTKHLKDVHQVTSDKTLHELDRKRTREEEIEELRSSQIIRQDPKRLRMLLETRDTILMNRPFSSGESNDKAIINDLMIAEDFRTSVNEKAVARSLIEIYVSTKREVIKVLSMRQPGAKSVKLVIDFWTCKVQHMKYLGVRVYFIDAKWKRWSVILGIRTFDPTYTARTQTGFRGCFLAWVKALLDDFGITQSEVFGGMTDGARDVRRLISEEMKKAWEWCIPHMMNAATKWACGLTDNAKSSVNPDLTALIERMRVTIRQVRDVEQMGDLFEALCQLEGVSKAVMLVDYQSHRFLGLTASLERVLEKWNPLVAYYNECEKQSAKKKAPSTFLLKNDRVVLSQLLSLLKPIAILKTLSQSEEIHQVKSLMLLFKIRQVTLDPKTPLRDYRSTAKAPIHIPTTDLLPIIVKTRKLLAEALDARFFSRYTDPTARAKHPYVFECQLFLHPRFKDLDDNLVKVVKYCALQKSDDFVRCDRIGSLVKDQVKDRIRRLMRDAQNGSAAGLLEEVDRAFQVQTAGELSMELDDLYGGVTFNASVDESMTEETRVEEELQRWATRRPTYVDCVLSCWEREESNFQLLSRVAKSIYAFPSSSAQIERDFGDAGRLVTKERASLKGYSVEMSSFVRANSEYVNIAQCDKIPMKELHKHIPKFMLEERNPEILPRIFSQRCSVDEAEEKAQL